MDKSSCFHNVQGIEEGWDFVHSVTDTILKSYANMHYKKQMENNRGYERVI